MDTFDTWSDDKILKNLESISKKFVSPEDPSFTEEELLVLKKLKQRSYTLSPLITQFFIDSFSPDMQAIKWS